MCIWLIFVAPEYDWLFRALKYDPAILINLLWSESLHYIALQKENVQRFVTAPIWHCTETCESLHHSLHRHYPLHFLADSFFICSGRFVISVGWSRRIDIYLVSVKWPACFPHDLILSQSNSPDDSHKTVDCHDLFLPPWYSLAFIAVHSISIFHLLQCFFLLKSARVLFGVVYSSIPSWQSIISSVTRAFVHFRKENLSSVEKRYPKRMIMTPLESTYFTFIENFLFHLLSILY